jgi:hypothetical protein
LIDSLLNEIGISGGSLAAMATPLNSSPAVGPNEEIAVTAVKEETVKEE